VSFATLGVAAVLVYGSQEQQVDFKPLGISPEDATRITDPTKQALWNDEVAVVLTARAGTPAPRGTPYAPPTVDALPVEFGIIDGVNSTREFVFTNGWLDPATAGRIQVLVGREYSNRAVGVVVVVDRADIAAREVYTVPGAGALQLTYVDEAGVFHIAAESGEQFTFTLESGTLSPVVQASPSPIVTFGPEESPIPTIGDVTQVPATVPPEPSQTVAP
jgi:hypothetical protein